MQWYRERGRHDLPWRLTCDPYAVLVSEVMLQQTQVERVLPYYERWMGRWPTVAELAAAPAAEAIREWSGLGYNRRAVNLQRAAVTVVEEHGGRLPQGTDALQRLPGVGPYTAAAVASFAFGRRVAVVETNIARVLARAVAGTASRRGLSAAREAEIAQWFLPTRGSRDHNLALMDLGAMVCTSRSPACEVCPLESQCAWRRAGSPPERAGRGSAATFEETTRFARGRIVEMLRQEPELSLATIACRLPGIHSQRAGRYLEALERDGLVEHGAGVWRLPGAVRAG